MSAPRKPRWELHRSIIADGQWWARFVAANGKIIVTSETYRRRRDAIRAIGLVHGMPVGRWVNGSGSVVPRCGDDSSYRDYLEVRDTTEADS